MHGNLDDNTALSRYTQHAWSWPRSLIHYSPLQQTCIVLLLNSHFVLSIVTAAVLSTLSRFASGGPLAAKRTVHGSHTWSGGTIYGNITCRRWSGGPVVAGDQLRRDSTQANIRAARKITCGTGEKDFSSAT